LVRNGNNYISLFLKFTLAGKSAVVFGVARAVYIFFFAVTHFGEEVFTGFNVYLTCAATANCTAVMVQMHIAIQGYI
jgi:hypothetical protein